jgi:hypothetical protein
MASRGLRGFRWGPARDNTLLYHPDMKPYDGLDEDGRRKDRDQVRTVPVQLAGAGEVPARLRALGFLSPNGIDGVFARLKPAMSGGVLEVPLVAVALEDAGAIEIAERALAAGLHVEAFVGKMPEHVFAEPGLRRRAAAILRQAWLIRVVREQTATEALTASCKVVIDGQGRVDEAALA